MPVAAPPPGAVGWEALPPVLACHYPVAAELNPALIAAFDRLQPAHFERRSHFIGGRFENLYVARERLPGLDALLGFAEAQARAVLAAGGPGWWPADATPVGGSDDDQDRANHAHRASAALDPPGLSAAPLRCGFWLNAMGPGQSTCHHVHAEHDELVSGVYYVAVPPDSGDILFHAAPFEVRVRPAAGLLLLFPPWLVHSVEVNRSAARRLSIALNVGLATVDS